MSSLSLYVRLIDTFPLACYFFDNEFKILHANPLCLKILNSSLVEIEGKLLASFYPEINLCVKNEGKNIKTFYLDKDLNKTEIVLNYASIENKTFGMLYIIVKPHSDPYKNKGKKYNETILDSMPADIAVFDKNHNYLYINPNGIRDVETREWIIGKSDFDYCDYKGLDKSMAEKRRDLFNIVVETKQQIEWLDEYHRENEDIYVLRRFCPVYIDGVFIYMIGYGIDVSELKRTQNKMLSNEIRNQNILNSALDAVVVIIPDGTITFWNAQAEIIFGWKSEEVLGKRLGDIIVPERFRKMHEAGIKNHSAGLGGATVNKIIEFPALNRNNEEFPIEFSILPIYDKGIVINYCSFIRDISFRKNKELEICQQNKVLENQNSELEQFTYITSHDLQEPLLSLISFSELLLDEYSSSLDADAKLYIEFINKSAIRMRALVTGLMEYARIGKRADVKELDCNQIITDVLSDLSVKIKKTETDISVENLPEIRGYETYIRLLFQNLIGNAIKYSKESEKCLIKIICSETENEWKFSVEDNGIGIAEKNLDQVFLIFKRLNNDSLDVGYGIGLAHCKKIVDIHDGEIYVKSKLGVGSTFSFTISKNI
jgi:PAS domain S-box-containing protein